MIFIEVECPNCGAQLELNTFSQTAFCNHCGSKIIVQEAVELDETVFMPIEKRIQNGEGLLRLNKFDKAYEVFSEITKISPERYEGWLGLFKTKSKNGKVLKEEYLHYIETALKCKNNEKSKKEILKLNSEIISYKNKINELNKLPRNRLDYEKKNLELAKSIVFVLIFIDVWSALMVLLFAENKINIFPLLLLFFPLLNWYINRRKKYKNYVKSSKTKIVTKNQRVIKNTEETKKLIQKLEQQLNEHEDELENLKYKIYGMVG